jgi:hypothetical protein
VETDIAGIQKAHSADHDILLEIKGDVKYLREQIKKQP